jgi:hypothetical protein
MVDDDWRQYEAQKQELRKGCQWIVKGLLEARGKTKSADEKRGNTWANHRVALAVERLIARVDRQAKTEIGRGHENGMEVRTSETIAIFLDACELVDAAMYACNFVPGIEKSFQIRRGKMPKTQSGPAEGSAEGWRDHAERLASVITKRTPNIIKSELVRLLRVELKKLVGKNELRGKRQVGNFLQDLWEDGELPDWKCAKLKKRK